MSAFGQTKNIEQAAIRKGAVALYVATALVSAIAYVPVSRFLIDDTFITLSYARNLALRGEWSLVADNLSNTATSPLNVLALAALTFVVRDAVIACGILFTLTMVALVAALRRIALTLSLPAAFAPLTAGLIALNPVVSSSIGLEVLLGSAALAWVAASMSEHRPISAGLFVGLAVVVRLDLIVVAAALVLLGRTSAKSVLSTIAVAAVTVSPWFASSWWWLGSALPDTVVIKTGQSSWEGFDFVDGILLYFQRYPFATGVAVVVPVLGAVCLVVSILVRAFRRNGILLAWGVGGVVYYVAYGFLAVPPYHWYYGVPVVAGTAVFVGTVLRQRGLLRRVGLLASYVAASAGAGVWIWAVLNSQVVPITTNHATPAQYRVVAADIAVQLDGASVQSAGEIGAISYYCECVIVDRFSDRGLLLPDLENREADAGASGWLWRLNFRNLDADALRTEGPIPLDYRLVRLEPGETSPQSVLEWPVTSPWTGDHRLFLVDGRDAAMN